MATESIDNGSIIRDRVARKAYAIWEAEGWPEGRALLHWIMAEQLIAPPLPTVGDVNERRIDAANAPDFAIGRIVTTTFRRRAKMHV